MNPVSAEILSKWYLRFNGFFIVENFIIHAADDPARVFNEKIYNYSEIDLLAIRFKFSHEQSANVLIKNDQKLVATKEYLIDFVIGEVKTGKSNKGNKIWHEKNIIAIKYILNFAGFIECEHTVELIAKELLENRIYKDKYFKYQIRFIIFSEAELNINFKNTTNVKLFEIINFICDRGKCWSDKNLGLTSCHDQWHPMIKDIFSVANNHELSKNEQISEIYNLLTK